MANKIKGNKTKELILTCAKQEFYDKGYNKAWVQTIAEKAEIRLGNLNYYFKKKDDIVKEIYDQFVVKIYQFIEARCACSELQKYCYFVTVIYKIILSDKFNRRFYSEVIVNKSNYRVLHELMQQYYQKIIDSLELNLIGTDFEVFVLTEFGSRREIFLAYFSGMLKISFEELIYYIIGNMYKNLGIETSMIENYLNNAFDFLDKNDIFHLKFLI